MTTNTSLATKILELMQTAFDGDPTTIHALCSNKLPCLGLLMHHPYLIVERCREDPETYQLGLLGILNGLLLSVDSAKFLAMQYEEVDGKQVIVGFTLVGRDEVLGEDAVTVDGDKLQS
jgi:hypothetical protein